MRNVLEQLENNEAILLMYLANELPPEDHAEVEQMLASDAALRKSLEELRGAQDVVMSGLAKLDLAEASNSNDAFAHRQVMREMRKWKLESPTHVIEKPAEKGLRYPWWVYPIASAAAIFFAFLAWWGNHDSLIIDPSPSVTSIADNTPIDEATAKHLDYFLADADTTARDQLESDRQYAVLVASFEDESSLISPEFRR